MVLLSRRARRVLGFIRPYTGVLVAVLVLMLVGTAMDLALPALLGEWLC